MNLSTFQMAAGGKKISVFESPVPECPILYLNTVRGEGEAVFKACQEIGTPSFTLVAVSGLKWDHDMSPWAIPPISEHDTPCTGGADNYLQLLTDEIIKEAEERLRQSPSYRCIAGYSLAGLFAVYALYQTNSFSRAASASGSFWFPDFTEFAMTHPLFTAPDRLYFSLGDREAKTKNPFLKTVEENTRMLHQYYTDRGIETTFVLNPGNHFTQPDQRMAAGINWLLTSHTDNEEENP